MDQTNKTVITVRNLINAPVKKVWEYWTKPEHITQWNNASDDWHSPRSENDLRVGGRFTTRMEAIDGSMGFDFGGVYDVVNEYDLIEYTMDDGRKVSVRFTSNGDHTEVVERFDAEETNPVDMQRDGWQAILDNFKKYAESNG